MMRRQLASFAAIGVIGFVVDGGLMTVLSAYGPLTPMEARPLSFAAAVTVTWWLNRSMTFAAPAPGSLGEWARYVAVNSAGALVNLVVFYLLMLTIPPLHRRPLLALGIAAAAALGTNFMGSKRLVFEAGPCLPHPGDAGPYRVQADDDGR